MATLVTAVDLTESQMEHSLREFILEFAGNACYCTGSTAGNIFTVEAISSGSLAVGQILIGPGLPVDTVITGLGSGNGGLGTYVLNTKSNVPSAQMMASAMEVVAAHDNLVSMPVNPFIVVEVNEYTRLSTNRVAYFDSYPAQPEIASEYDTQPIQLRAQIDCYGPNSGDWANILTTAWRSELGVDFLAQRHPWVTPIYADDPTHIPLVDGENQYTKRWMVKLYGQANVTLSSYQQFCSHLKVGLINVPATYQP
jgi:hypothetical protein